MSSTGEVWVGVVTPVFNGERYLADCIECVLAQTHTQFDYIIVDNCSTDQSLAIAERYAKRDSRIRVVPNETFLDQIANFNRAMDLVPARAEYYKFALADDRIVPTCLDSMVQVATANPTISIVGAYESNGVDVCCQGIPFGESVISGRAACRIYFLKGRYLFGSPNCLLYRASALRRRTPVFRSDDGYYEDADICFDLLRDSDFGFVHQVLTFTRRDNVSTVSRIESFRPWFLSELFFLRRYGRDYLATADFEARWKTKLQEYLFFLGDKGLGRWDKAFWQFHKEGMAKMGYTLRAHVLAWNVVLAFLDAALNPKMTIQKRLNRWKATQT